MNEQHELMMRHIMRVWSRMLHKTTGKTRFNITASDKHFENICAKFSQLYPDVAEVLVLCYYTRNERFFMELLNKEDNYSYPTVTAVV